MTERAAQTGNRESGDPQVTPPTERGSKRWGWKLELLLAAAAVSSPILGSADGMFVSQMIQGESFKSIGDLLSTPTRLFWPVILGALSACAGVTTTREIKRRLMGS